MTEAQWTRNTLKVIRERNPHFPLVWKVNDRMTAGIPDVVMVTGPDRVWWWEFKKAATETQQPSAMLTPKQDALLTRLAKSSDRVAVIVLRPSGRVQYYRDWNAEPWAAFITKTIAANFLSDFVAGA